MHRGLYVLGCCTLGFSLLYVCVGRTTPPPPPRRGGTSEGGGEIWGYTTPREGVNLFWWLYKTTDQRGVQQSPLIIWIQGGPGLSGTAVGNFLEIGPLDHNTNPRNATWVQAASILFIDSPVGTGFSYYDNDTLIPTHIYAIADDAFEVVYDVLTENPELMTTPVYVFGQSYGGKMAPALARRIQNEIGGRLPATIDLRAVCLGNGFTSPVDTLMHSGPYLYEMSLIDEKLLNEVQSIAGQIPELLRLNRTVECAQKDIEILTLLWKKIPGINFYDSADFYKGTAQKSRRKRDTFNRFTDAALYGTIYDVSMTNYMNTEIKEKLQIIPDEVSWNGDFGRIYNANGPTLITTAVPLVEELLASGVHVVVYQGQRDVMCNTAGAMSWVRKLNWPHIVQYTDTERTPLFDPDSGKIEMFAKDYSNLHMYWVLNAGHAVPSDVPDAALRMLQRILATTPQGDYN